MRENGTDRDVALQIKQLLSDCADCVATINYNLYTAQITTQPTDVVGTVGYTSTLSCAAINAVAYQWKYRAKDSSAAWTNMAGSGNNTDTVSVGVTSNTPNLEFACFITGKDGGVVQTNIVYVTIEE